MIVMNIPSIMHWIVDGVEVEMWWNMLAFLNAIKEVMGSPKSQVILIVFQKMRVVRNQWRNMLPQLRLKKKTKKKV